MGHLLFAGVFAVFVLILFSKVFFSYIYAAKKEISSKTNLRAETSDQSRRFHVKKVVTVIGGVLVLFTPFVMLHFLNLLKEKPEHSDALWILIDLLILVFFIFVLLFFTGLRSYIYIHEDGFEYRNIFKTQSYSKDQIEHVCQTSEFIFIKRRAHWIPIVLETIYVDSDDLYGMLYDL